MAVKFASSRRSGVQDLFHRRSSGGGGSVSSRRSRSSISSSKRSSNKSNKRGRQSSLNRRSSRSRSRSRSRTRSNSKHRQRRHRDENDNTNKLIVNKSFEQKLTQDVESMSASQQRHLNSSKRTKHKRRHTADSTTTKSTKSSSTAPTYCHDGIDLLFSDVISPLSGAICTFLTTCLCDDALVDGADDNKNGRHLHRVSSPGVNCQIVNRQIVNRRIPQRSRRGEKMLTSSNNRRVSPTVNGVVLKQEEYNVLQPQPIEGASAVVVEEEEVIMYY